MQEYLERLVRYGGPNGLSVLAGLSPHVLEEARCSASRVLVKDNTDVKGMHTAADRPASADNLAERDAPVMSVEDSISKMALGPTKRQAKIRIFWPLISPCM